jgi:hypothetical protein
LRYVGVASDRCPLRVKSSHSVSFKGKKGSDPIIRNWIRPLFHKGKPAWYTVSLYDDTGTLLLGSIGIELQGNGWTQINFDSYATFEELCDIDKAFCECNGWCAAAEYGSGRQSGGSSGGGGGVCELAQTGESCTVNNDCCSSACKGKPGKMTCK